jgi:branched-chain amino acid transport system ATP-binding protein
VLRLEAVSAFHGDLQALFDVSLEVTRGEIVAVIGANAAGKTTLLRAISGLVSRVRGRILLEDTPLHALPAHRIVDHGLVHVPEGRSLFPFMTVRENLEMGAYSRAVRSRRQATLAEVFELFPVLAERREQLAGSLSGGEQQMLALGRGLMARPRLLTLDEPSLGLAPLMVRKCFDSIREISARGTTILLVEQHVHHALAVADRAYVLESGRLVLGGTAKEVLESDLLRQAYTGV